MFDFFADKLKLQEWDWLAIIIALFALSISVISMLIARNTLRSQRQTEINTTPLINKSIQEYLLNDLLIRLFDGFTKISILSKLLNKRKFNYYPTEDILEDILLDDTVVHLEVFYNDKKNYAILRGLHDMIISYNNHIRFLNKYLSTTTVTKKLLQNEIYSLLAANEEIADTWSYVMSLSYGYDSKQKSHVIEYVYQVVINDYANSESPQTRLFDENNCYIKLMEVDSKEQYVDNMNKLGNSLMKYFESKLIKKS